MKKVKHQRFIFYLVFVFTLATYHLQLATVSHAYTHDTSLIKWREYTSSAFEEAKKENRPLFMLITAVWCHWCHVYEEKTLETKEIADYINNNYIPVFVDYDRRKDIAARYPVVGLPATVIMAPNGEEIVAVPGFIEKDRLLASLKKTYAYVKEEFKPKTVEEANDIYREKRNLSKDDLQKYLKAFERHLFDSYDTQFGGFGFKEKMPYGKAIDYMLDIYESDKDKKWLNMVVKTLNGMAGKTGKAAKSDEGIGLFDKVEGGFFRYATQRDWSAPHYEKMLEDQADIIKAYLHAFKITKNPFYKDVAKKSLGYVISNLYDEKDGRFYGSQDADEVYYHFTPDERKKADVPKVDKTSYTHTNANMIMTFLYAANALKDDHYKNIAVKTLYFFLNNMMTDNGILSFYDPRKKKGFLDGQSEDNAWFAAALIETYKTTKEKVFLEKADALIGFSIKNLYNEKDGGFIERKSTSKEFYKENELISFKRPYTSNGIMTNTLTKAYELTKNKQYLEKAKEVMGLFFEEIGFESVPFQRVAKYLSKR